MNKSADPEATDEIKRKVNRRKFMYYGGWGIMGLFVAAVLGSSMRFFFPRTLFEPPTKYTIGYLSEYAQGVRNVG